MFEVCDCNFENVLLITTRQDNCYMKIAAAVELGQRRNGRKLVSGVNEHRISDKNRSEERLHIVGPSCKAQR